MDMGKIKLGFFLRFSLELKVKFILIDKYMKNIGLYLELYQNYKVTSKNVLYRNLF